jgi:hypothetical protein
MSRKSKPPVVDAVITVQRDDDDGLTGFTEYLNMWADKTLSLATLTDEEKTTLTFARHQLNILVPLLRKRISAFDKHLVGRVMEAAFFIGCDAVRSPILERMRHQATNSGAAHARKSRDANSRDIDRIILDCARPLWKNDAPARNSAGFTASKILKQVVSHLGGPNNSPIKTANALEKRLRKLMPTRTTVQSSG